MDQTIIFTSALARLRYRLAHPEYSYIEMDGGRSPQEPLPPTVRWATPEEDRP